MLRLKAGILGTACVVVGAGMFLLDAKLVMTGVQASAVLVERVEECQAEFQPTGESRRKEPMSCEIAIAFRNAVGANKVRVHKTSFAILRLPTADGSQRTVKVNETTLNAHAMPVGSSIPVVYNASTPDDVRLPMNFARAKIHFELMGLGVLLLVIAFIVPILQLMLGAGSGKDASSADQATPELTRGELALLSARDAQRERAGGAPQLRSPRRGATGMAAAGGMRHQFGTRS